MVHTLRSAGHTAYLAGGCVRDTLLGLSPKDYDVATDAPPESVRGLFRRTAAVGEAFGVVLVYLPKPGRGRHTIEVATFRAEGPYSDGRRPDAVRFTNAEEDAKRRDFTINGLFASPPEGGAGEDTIIDFVGGRADLEAGIIRAIGDPSERFGEDYLRMLRAVRFAARMGFAIEPATAQAIRDHAPQLDRIARERIGDEVRRMMSAPPPVPGVAAGLLADLGLAEVIFGRAIMPNNVPILRLLDAESDYPTRLLSWLMDLGLPCRDPRDARPRDSLNLSNHEDEAMKATAKLWGAIESDWEGASTAQRKRLAASERFAPALQLVRATDPTHAERVAASAAQLAADGIGLAPKPLITGDDLIAIGLKPGPKFKALLDRAYDAQLEGRVTTKTQALHLVRDANA